MLPETHYPVDPDPATIAERARIIQRLRRRHGKSIPAAALDAAGLPSRTGTGRVVSASRLAILDAAQRIAAYGAPVTLAALLEELGLPVRERGRIQSMRRRLVDAGLWPWEVQYRVSRAGRREI